jgi:hypothetical protein
MLSLALGGRILVARSAWLARRVSICDLMKSQRAAYPQIRCSLMLYPKES